MELTIQALLLGVARGLECEGSVGGDSGPLHYQADALCALAHGGCEFRLGFAVEHPTRCAFRRLVGAQEVGLPVHVEGYLLSYLVEPTQADIAEGSSVVVPDGDIHGFGGHVFPPRLDSDMTKAF